MIDFFIDAFGAYAPLIDPVTNLPYEGIACIDFTWIAAVLSFFIILIYLLRIILAFFKGVDWK